MARHRSNCSDIQFERTLYRDMNGSLRRGSPTARQHNPADDGEDEQQREQQAALRALLADTLGEEEFETARLLYVELSNRQAAAALLDKTDGSAALRLKRRQRQSLARRILLGMFRADHALPAHIRHYFMAVRIEWMAAAGMAELGRTNGATISPRTARNLTCDVWAASVFGHEEWLRSVTKEDLADYIRRKLAVLVNEDDVYLGLWRRPGSGEVCLDVSKVFPDVEMAATFARLHGQEAIMNLMTLEEKYIRRRSA